MKTKFLFLLLFTSAAFFSKAQNLPKVMLLFELGGHHSIFNETIDQGIPLYEKSVLISPKVGIGLNLGTDLFAYLNVGYGYGKDTIKQGYMFGNIEVPVQEIVHSSIPMIGFGFVKYIKLGNTPFYFNTDFSFNLDMGKLSGNLSCAYRYGSQQVEVDLLSEGQHTLFNAGLAPGMMVKFKSNWFVNLSVGFVGYSFESRNLKYTDGFDESSSSSTAKVDFTGSSIKLRIGLMF